MANKKIEISTELFKSNIVLVLEITEHINALKSDAVPLADFLKENISGTQANEFHAIFDENIIPSLNKASNFMDNLQTFCYSAAATVGEGFLAHARSQAQKSVAAVADKKIKKSKKA